MSLKDYSKLKRLILISVLLIVVSGYISFHVARKKQKNLTFKDFLNNGSDPKSSNYYKSIGIGMVSGLVFGFVDNAGLFWGMDAIDNIIPENWKEKNTSSCRITSGLGNTYSDLLGAFLGTFIGKIIQDISGIENTPIWSEAAGFLVGCLLGIFIPKTLEKMTKQKNN